MITPTANRQLMLSTQFLAVLAIVSSVTAPVMAQTPTASVTLTAPPGPEPDPDSLADLAHGPLVVHAVLQSGSWTCFGYAAAPEPWYTADAAMELKLDNTLIGGGVFTANYSGTNFQVAGVVSPATSARTLYCSISVNVNNCPGCASANDTAAETIPAECGDSRDPLIKEYTTYQVNLKPSCSDFSQDGPNDFNHSEDNSHQPWGIVKSVLFVKRAQIQEYALYQVRLTSGYRCPHINATVPGSASQSRHMYGDAMDMTPPPDRWSPPTENEFNHLHNAAAQTSPSFITSWTTYADHHLHVDWR